MSTAADRVVRTLAYHERTKHHPQRYAAALGYLDWDTQPDPFRTYAGAPRVDLPLRADDVDTPYGALWEEGGVAPRPLGVDSIAAFLELALGLTAWKEYGESRWALRSDPSSGNLHPTEGYLALPSSAGVPAGVYHYVSRDHCLEQRCALDAAADERLQRSLPAGAFLMGIASIHWREAWKYGERAFRYCQHDAGHVIATARIAAACLGWSARLLDGLGDANVARLLGLDRDEDFRAVDAHDREHPDTVLFVAPPAAMEDVPEVERDVVELADLVAAGAWVGAPNELSSGHADWDVIDAVAEATRRPPAPGSADPAVGGAVPRAFRPSSTERAATIIRQRRSAVALDGKTSMSRDVFYAMLERTLPGPAAPFDVLPWAPRLHLGLFVHRVDGVAPGLYVLERASGVHEALREMVGEKARWTRPPECPEHLRLFCIAETDCRRVAAAVSCQQDIAGDGAFSLGMVAEFRATVESGAHEYRRLFWESGVLGQVLYLEAEAAGVRGTGIGCYFDDAFHQVLGLEGDRFQSLYHFTVGGPVEDDRLVTRPAYAHLEEARR